MTARKAAQIGLPTAADWWLLDDEQVIVMGFDGQGRIAGKVVTTTPEHITWHCEWRDLAVRNAIPAEEFTAA